MMGESEHDPLLSELGSIEGPAPPAVIDRKARAHARAMVGASQKPSRVGGVAGAVLIAGASLVYLITLVERAAALYQ